MGFSKHFKTFINKCLIKDPQKRLSAQELLSLPFISRYSKDRQFMIHNFVKHIKKIQIKQCNDLDLPSSVLEARKKEANNAKAKKFQVKVDTASGDDGAKDDDFTFSTSLSNIDVDSMKNEIEEEEEENATKKGKFTVTKIKEEKPKQSKFKVTSVNESGDKSEIKSAEAPKTKSRFKVTTVHDK